MSAAGRYQPYYRIQLPTIEENPALLLIWDMDAEHSKLAVKQVEELVNQTREQRERFTKLWNKVEGFGAAVKSSEKQPEQSLFSIVPLSQLKRLA